VTRYLLDSNAANDYINRRLGVYERACAEVAKGNPVGISMPVLAELLAGYERSSSREKSKLQMEEAISELRLWPFDKQACYFYAMIASQLMTTGKPIGTIDMLIASTVLAMAPCTIVTTDSDFQAIPGLRIDNWRTSTK
jgi:tRNA(fMet)-specific endonuclease VapC